MLIRVCSFTKTGNDLACRVFENIEEFVPVFRKEDEKLDDFTRESFKKHLPIVFIGACGIAVRAIAPYVSDKLLDSPVVVIDERGKYIIPILSGHMGGANELAVKIANDIGGKAVITTATDVEKIFSVDVFAKKNRLKIINREGIRIVSEKLLNGMQLGIYVDDDIEIMTKLDDKLIKKNMDAAEIIVLTEEKANQFFNEQSELSMDAIIKSLSKNADIVLVASEIILGIGCKKNKSFEEIDSFIKSKIREDESLAKLIGNNLENVNKIASIDLKKNEIGLLEFSAFYHIPFITYGANTLKKVEGEFSESSFVKEKTGVSNVCERAAMCASGNDGELLYKKMSGDGVTLAVAKRLPKIYM